jgi:CRISPR/Cas system-associated exonuclease Cas4 (RecB family)
MNTQTLLEEKRALLQETKELIVDESKVFGGIIDISSEIADVLSIEYKKRSRFLA